MAKIVEVTAMPGVTDYKLVSVVGYWGPVPLQLTLIVPQNIIKKATKRRLNKGDYLVCVGIDRKARKVVNVPEAHIHII